MTFASNYYLTASFFIHGEHFDQNKKTIFGQLASPAKFCVKFHAGNKGTYNRTLSLAHP